MNLEAIAAISKNRCIGVGNELPWHYKEDMKHFRKITRSRVVIMGRKTFESIGKPLPKRINLILTRDEDWEPTNAEGHMGTHVVHSKEEALELLPKIQDTTLNPMVIGGGEVYKLFLPETSKIHLTLVKKECEGDTFFPELSENEWEVEEAINSLTTPELQFQTWVRK